MNNLDFKLLFNAWNIEHIILLLSTVNSGYSLNLLFVACHLSKWIKILWLRLIPQ